MNGEAVRHVLVRFPKVAGMDLSITNEVVLVWIAAACTFVLLAPACRRRSLLPRGLYQNLVEGLIDIVEREVVHETVGPAERRWAPFLLALFFFVLLGNLLGLVPVPGFFKAATSNINVTSALAVIVFAMTLFLNVRRHGVLGFLRKFVPEDVSPWLAALVVPIEILSWLFRPVSLALRLFANMMAGHHLILVFVGMAATSLWLVKPLPLAGAVLISAFEVFIAFVQAFVFALLAGLYIREAVEAHE
jgi:F-type H+-transporting ATPase subunit a